MALFFTADTNFGEHRTFNEGEMDSDLDGYLLGELFKSFRGRDDADQLERARWDVGGAAEAS